MAKASMVDNFTRSISGTLNIETMSIERMVDENGVETSLKEVLEMFDGKEITITIKQKEEL